MSGTNDRSTMEVLEADRCAPVVVATKPDGSARIVRTLVGSRVAYEVIARSADGGGSTLIRTEHDDVAAAVYDAFDGTSRPWHAVYQPRGFNNREETGGLSKVVWVFAVGATVEAAIHAFADSVGSSRHAVGVDHVEERDGEWESRFTIDGTAMKAGGRIVPGGYVVTDWK